METRYLPDPDSAVEVELVRLDAAGVAVRRRDRAADARVKRDLGLPDIEGRVLRAGWVASSSGIDSVQGTRDVTDIATVRY